MPWSFAAAGLSGLLGIASNAIQYNQQKKLLRLQNEYNTEMWEKNNAYNTPTQQLNRMKEAGISPAMANGITPIPSNAPSSGSAGTVAPPDFSGVAPLLQQHFQQEYERPYRDSAANADMLRAITEGAKGVEDISNTKLRNKYQEIINKYAEQNLQQQINESKSREKLNLELGTTERAKQDNIDKITLWYDSRTEAEINTMYINARANASNVALQRHIYETTGKRLNETQIYHIQVDALQSFAKIANLNKQGRLFEAMSAQKELENKIMHWTGVKDLTEGYRILNTIIGGQMDIGKTIIQGAFNMAKPY